VWWFGFVFSGLGVFFFFFFFAFALYCIVYNKATNSEEHDRSCVFC